MKKNIAVYFSVLLFILLFVFSACAQPPATPTLPPTPTPVHLKVHLQPLMSFAPFILAAEEGYFAEQGLDVEFVNAGTAVQATPLLLSGALDIVAGPIAAAQINAMTGGVPVKYVADKGYLDPKGCVSNAFAARSDLLNSGKLSDPSQLRGLRVNASPNSFIGYLLDGELKKANLTFNDLSLVNLAEPDALAALEAGTLDVSTLGEPNLSQLTADGKGGVWLPFYTLQPDSELAVIVYGPSLVEKNPDAGKRFMVAYLKGVRQYNLGKTDRNLDVLSKKTGLDRERLKQICWTPIHSDGMIDVSSITHFQEWGVQHKLFDKVASPDQFWDPSFIQYANQVLGKQ